MILDLITSGNSCLKIFSTKHSKSNLPQLQNCRKLLKSIDSESTKLSFLFNAFTEATIGEIVHYDFKDCFHSIHSDSGGLQMITRGIELNQKQKEDIYKVQGKYSDIAMCFDEIPITTSSETVSVTNMSVRFFDHKLIKEKAIETGQNLRQQIKTFQDIGSTTKPMLILQGNCIKSFQEWINYTCDTIDELLPYIHGISLAGTSLGGGHLEDVVRAASAVFCQYPNTLNTKNIHLLGVGAAARLVPFVSFKDQLYDAHISFDSTTYAHALFKGTIIIDGKTFNTNTLSLTMIEKIISDINSFIKPITGSEIKINDFKDVYYGSNQYKKKTNLTGAECPKFIETLISIFTYMIYNNLANIENIFNMEDTFKLYTSSRGGFGAYQHLSNCKTKEDFSLWYSEFSRYLKSDKVTSSNEKRETVSINSFF